MSLGWNSNWKPPKVELSEEQKQMAVIVAEKLERGEPVSSADPLHYSRKEWVDKIKQNPYCIIDYHDDSMSIEEFRERVLRGDFDD